MFGRFERKIIAAILAVAVMPLVGALFLGQRALREAYAVGVNAQVRAELERGLSVYQTHFEALRADADRTATACARDVSLSEAVRFRDDNTTVMNEALPRALAVLLEKYQNVVALEVLDRDGKSAYLQRRDGVDLSRLRLLTLPRVIEQGSGARLLVTIGASASEFGDYQRAGEITEVFRALERGSDYVSGFYLAVYIGLLISVIVLALGVGIMLSRRVTVRVSQLAEATERVGAGDLSVQVPGDERDEVGDLTRAFNRMVTDIRESRERIDYLSRISAWQEFARRLAHEIKNPLTPIQLSVQEAHRSYRGDDARFKRTLEDTRAIVEEEIATLRRLVGEFSEFARLPEVHLAEHDLGEFVRDAMESPFRLDEQDDERAPIRIHTFIEPRPLPVKIDAMLLKRCLDNLVRNAAQALRGHKPEGGGNIHVAVRREETRALLEVRDDGPGVPSEVRERVFDPYYTTKAEGTGLGLAIVKKIVLEHGGEIDCSEAKEGGACFRIALPLANVVRQSLRP